MAPLPGSWTTDIKYGLTQQANFPTLSWFYRASSAAEPDPSERVAFSYAAADRRWEIQVPGTQRSSFLVMPTETGQDYSGLFFNAGGGGVLYMTMPGLQNRVIQLESTSVGYWGWSVFNGAARGDTGGVMAYGVPTAWEDMPSSGSGRYQLYGFAAVRPRGATGDPDHAQFIGAVTVQFRDLSMDGEFSTGTVPGYRTYARVDQRYVMVDARPGFDGAYFAGRLVVPGLEGEATFEGGFTGPQARELLLRWKGPYRDPATGRIETVYGVLAGRR